MKRKLVLILLVLICRTSFAQNAESNKSSNFFIKAYNAIFNNFDTLYIEEDKYYMNLSLQSSNWFDSYYIKSNDEFEQSLTIQQQPSYNIGAYIGWDIISVGWSLNILDTFKKSANKKKKTEFDMSLITTFMGCDMYYRHFTDGFKLKNTQGIIDKSVNDDVKTNIDGVESKLIGINGWYLFNRKRVAYSSVYSHSYRQLKNAGSFLLGASYTLHEFRLDTEKLPEIYQQNISDGLKFNKFSYHNISIGIGYTYNWRLGKNFNANVTLIPSLAYRISRIDKEEKKDPYYRNFQFEILGKAGIVYNNSKYFAGCNVQFRTYTNFKKDVSMVNNLGYITAFVGFNFWKRK